MKRTKIETYECFFCKGSDTLIFCRLGTLLVRVCRKCREANIHREIAPPPPA